MVTATFFLTHFLQFFFAPPHQPFWMGAVWGNVVAVLPLFVLGAAGFAYHHFVLKKLHASHDRHLKILIDLIDPTTDGGISILGEKIDIISDKVDENTPGGIRAVLDRLEK